MLLRKKGLKEQQEVFFALFIVRFCRELLEV